MCVCAYDHQSLGALSPQLSPPILFLFLSSPLDYTFSKIYIIYISLCV